MLGQNVLPDLATAAAYQIIDDDVAVGAAEGVVVGPSAAQIRRRQDDGGGGGGGEPLEDRGVKTEDFLSSELLKGVFRLLEKLGVRRIGLQLAEDPLDADFG